MPKVTELARNRIEIQAQPVRLYGLTHVGISKGLAFEVLIVQ